MIAYAVISTIPGPSVFMVTGQALSGGSCVAVAYVAGDLAGCIIAIAASYLGLGLNLASSNFAFVALRWLGVAYIACLGITQIIAARNLTEIKANGMESTRGSLGAGFLTRALYPKAIMSYMASLAQFIEPNAPQLPQFLVLMVTSAVVIALVHGTYAVSGSVPRCAAGLITLAAPSFSVVALSWP